MTYDIADLLSAIDPSFLSYQEWVNVGMALKEGGYTAAEWDEWSRRDGARYHAGECEKKWRSFAGTAEPVTMGTVVQYARNQGWTPPPSGYALDWDSSIGPHDREGVVVDRNWLEERELPQTAPRWDPARELTTYLETLFEASENVGFVTESWEKDGRYLPTRGHYDRTAGELIELLGKCKGDVGSVIGDYRPEAGAWIRFNPLDGKGVKNENVTEYRYALVESDTLPVEQQYAMLTELELPIAMLVHSGGKSLHAIVKIGAADYAEYRRRVDYLYEVCAKNGLKIDTQNRNPSRLSRMPGVTRGGNRQYIVAREIGRESWDAWKEWVEARSDDLPEPESMADAWDHLPELARALIEGVLRLGHKMLLVGPSKAGKSFALIELCIAIAEGGRWMGWPCTQGRVLYVNLELDRASCLHRFRDVYEALGVPAAHLGNIDIWNLRGLSQPMDSLAPKLIRRAAKKGYIAIVIDPIYKVITGDENSADQMAKFCNQFDMVCTQLNCAVIYCHHHSKGSQGQKRSMDRASGSGVFARDPDAMLDMIELDVTEELRKAESDRAVCKVYEKAFEEYGGDQWSDEVSQDDLCSAAALRDIAKNVLTRAQEAALQPALAEARRRAQQRTAWRIEGTLREFAPFPPMNVWFDYPVHRQDGNGSLGDLKTGDEGPAWQQKQKKQSPAQRRTAKQRERREALEKAYEALSMNGEVTMAALIDYTGLTRNTLKNYVDEHPDFERGNEGTVIRKNDGEEVSK